MKEMNENNLFLGTTLFLIFLSYQVTIVVCIFTSISANLNTVFEPWQNMINAAGFFTASLYSTSTLYFITKTAESAFKELKTLTIPLQEKMLKEKDPVEQLKIKHLIEKVEKVRPLSGNGYFEISRETLTSIVGISITYLIILLQFRTA